MIENEVQLKIQQKLENLLNESGFIKSIQIKPEQKVGNFSVDLVADVQINGDNDKLVVEVKSLGEPKQVRASIQQLKQYIKLIESIGIAGDIIRYEENQIYGIVAAPYITEDSANICKENNIGFIDLAGNSYLKFGSNNPVSEVTKLQSFLKNVEGLNVDINGIFDTKTVEAVKAFQTKYANEVMTPWGMTVPTGNVYITTKQKIDEISCNMKLSLTSDKLAEINNYKNGISTTDSKPRPLNASPSFSWARSVILTQIPHLIHFPGSKTTL